MMNTDRGFGFVGGFVLGGLIGAVVTLLLAPASGEETRGQIRAEGVALKNRGQEFGNDRMHDAQKMVKQGQKGVADTQTRTSRALEDQKMRLAEAIDAGKQAASRRKDEMLNRFDDNKVSQVHTKA